MCPLFEDYFVDAGIQLFKYWLEVGEEQQRLRFERRIEDSRRQWKLSPTDLESRRKWYGYSRARDQMFEAADTENSPWYSIRSDDKRKARLNCIAHLLSIIPYDKTYKPSVKVPERLKRKAYGDVASIQNRHWIPENF